MLNTPFKECLYCGCNTCGNAACRKDSCDECRDYGGEYENGGFNSVGIDGCDNHQDMEDTQ